MTRKIAFWPWDLSLNFTKVILFERWLHIDLEDWIQSCGNFGNCVKIILLVDPREKWMKLGERNPLGAVDCCASLKSQVIVTEGFIVKALFRLMIRLDNTRCRRNCNAQHSCCINQRLTLWVLRKNQCAWPIDGHPLTIYQKVDFF